MPNYEQLKILKQGAKVWNKWRKDNQDKNQKIDLNLAALDELDLQRVDLFWANLKRVGLREAILDEADLSFSKLSGADLTGAKLTGACLEGADLRRTDLRGADLSSADLEGANLCGAILENAILSHADITEAVLCKANLRGAKLDYADLSFANLSEADVSEADLYASSWIHTRVEQLKISGSRVYGINIWNLEGKINEEESLYISHGITVDHLRVAQFIDLILDNREIRDVINTLTSKTVLILGRFSIPERKAILDALRNEVQKYDLVPVVFDFDRPTDLDFTETIKILAGISYFVIADITNPKSSPLELQAIIPDFQIPLVPIIQEDENPFSLMGDLKNPRPWVLDTITYDSLGTLIKILKPHIIDPAIKKRDELRIIKAKVPTILSGRELIKKRKSRKP